MDKSNALGKVFPKRWIHLDFHTGPAIPDVGRDFDAQTFSEPFVNAAVDSVTLFAMCHHGHLYYDTPHPARHPSLPTDLDLLGEQIEALQRVGIQTPIYLSVQVNEYAANQHPEWIALTPELQHVKAGNSAFRPAWQILDMSSPYREYFTNILQQVLTRFAPTDGIFLDMCWDQPSCSPWAIRGMKEKNLDPRSEADRKRYARELSHSYMHQYQQMVEAAHDRQPIRIWFNSRPKTNLQEERKFLRHVEIESLPTGGWGYAYFPYTARFVRPLGLPTLGMTGRFFRSWGDNASLKPPMALKYECCQVLSQGMSCSVGDLLHPRGVPQLEVYDLIGSVYKHLQACEPYVEGGSVVTEMAVLVDPKLGDNPGPSGLGLVRALQQLHYQFDLLASGADFSEYPLVIIPETTSVSGRLATALQQFLEQGGALLMLGRSALDTQGQPILSEQGFIPGDDITEECFLHALPSVSEGIGEYGYVMYESSYAMEPQPGTDVLVRLGRSYFPRSYDRFSGHDYTAEGRQDSEAGAVQSGRTITVSVPLAEAYGKHAAPNYRTLLGNLINRLLPQPKIRFFGPSVVETSVIKKERDLIVHVLSFSPERRCPDLDIIEDPFPIVNEEISIRCARKPERVFLAPGEEELEFQYRDGYVHTNVTILDGHRLLVLEGAEY